MRKQRLAARALLLIAFVNLAGGVACTREEPLGAELRHSTFEPDSGAFHPLPINDSIRIRWYEGYYTLRWDSSGVKLRLAACQPAGKTFYTPKYKYNTAYVSGPIAEWFQVVDNDLMGRIGLEDSLPALPITVPPGPKSDIWIIGIFRTTTVPLTAYRDHLVGGTWFEKDHIAPTLSYRNFEWHVDYRACNHEQGSGG